MKRRVLLSVLLSLITLITYSNNKFYNNTTQWCQMSYSFDAISVYNFHIDKDTVVNGLTYQVVRNDYNNKVSALLRTTDDNMVYRYNFKDNTEYCIYDFGEWYVGKELPIDNYINGGTPEDIKKCQIYELGTVTDANGNILDYMQVEVTFQDDSKQNINDKILHGIGSTWSILSGKNIVVMPNGEKNQLLSFNRDGKSVYDAGYKIYPINTLEHCDETIELSASIEGEYITIVGSLLTGWGDDKCAVVKLDGNRLKLYLANTSLYLDNFDNYQFSVTAFIGDLAYNEIYIELCNTCESATIYPAGVYKHLLDKESLVIYNNGDALMAEFPTAQAGEAITLYDATGRAVATQAVRQGATTANIDVATLPAGVYIARLNSGATAKVVL